MEISADGVDMCSPLCAIATDPDFHQLVKRKRRFEFVSDCLGQAFISDRYQRVNTVG
jgi:hypothetical protein